jgi:hypothetical protein
MGWSLTGDDKVESYGFDIGDSGTSSVVLGRKKPCPLYASPSAETKSRQMTGKSLRQRLVNNNPLGRILIQVQVSQRICSKMARNRFPFTGLIISTNDTLP